MKIAGALRAEPVAAETILAELAELRRADLPTHGGRLFAYVYDPAVSGLDELATAAHALAAHTNGLDPTAFPSLLALENDLVAAAAGLLTDDTPTAPDAGAAASGARDDAAPATPAAPDTCDAAPATPAAPGADAAPAAPAAPGTGDGVAPAAVTAAVGSGPFTRPAAATAPAASAPSTESGTPGLVMSIVDRGVGIAGATGSPGADGGGGGAGSGGGGGAGNGGGSVVDGVVGSVTSGGTESLLLAVKAARDAAPEVAAPRIVVPATAHAAFAKAGAYLRVALDVVPVDPATLRPDPAAMAAAIGPDTVLVACSAPAYPYGVIDPVAEIAAVAAKAGVRCHVDACFGGWLLPYLRRLGRPVPRFGFEVPGVTSISVDLHKYAYAPKGTSVLLHRNAALRRSQYFGYADWPGYPMLNATVASTRSGGPIAAAWATLRHLGDTGYLRLAERTLTATTGIAAAVSGVDGLRLMAEPESSVVAFTSTAVDLFVLADELAARGWHTQAQLPFAELPASIHLTVTAAVVDSVDDFADALRAAVDAARVAGPAPLPAELVASLGALDPATLTPETVAGLAAAAGLGAGAAPQRMATVNALLSAVAPATRAALLVEFVSLLQRPPATGGDA